MESRDTSPLFEEIVREIGWYSTALFPIVQRDGQAKILAPGTGTFVRLDCGYFILTALHVWEALQKATAVGLTLKEDARHESDWAAVYTTATGNYIPVAAVECFSLPRPGKWNDRGPDLALLRLPSEVVGAVRVYKNFYDLKLIRSDRKPAGELIHPVDAEAFIASGSGDCELQGRVLMGTPEELGLFSELRDHADVQITGVFLNPDAQPETVGGFDYLDFEIGAASASTGIPDSFEGISGGGLWRFFTKISRDTGRRETAKILDGVAFYQLDRAVRCHGMMSVRGVIEVAEKVLARPQ